MKGYQIQEDKKSKYAARKAVSLALMITGGVLLLFLVLMLAVDNGFQVLQIVKWHWFVVIIAGIFGLRYVQELNLASAVVFLVEKDRIVKGYHAQMLNAGNKYGLQKGERRYGSKPQQEIKITDISRIKITDKKIKILSKDYNFFNGNGMIEIPAEVNEYEALKRQFASLQAKLKV